jgi:hypothetical protein
MIKLKKLFFLFSFLIVISEFSFSNSLNKYSFPADSTRNYLQITKRNNNRVLAFRTGEKITVFAKGLKFKGRITAVTSDKIYIDRFPPIYIDDIEKIQVKSILYSVMGGILLFVGVDYLIVGIVAAIISPGSFVPGLIVAAIGGGMTYLGLDVFRGREYQFRMWQFESSCKYKDNSNINFIDE